MLRRSHLFLGITKTGFELYLSTELYFALEGSIQIIVHDSDGYIYFIQITQYYDT